MRSQLVRVGILGATGAVGQHLVARLATHPWFTVTEVVASPRSAGRRYSEAVRWRLPAQLPEATARLVVKDIEADLRCDLLLSALDSDAAVAEEPLARAGFPVVSNSSRHRLDEDVPLIIPEVNPGHLDAIAEQRRRRGYAKGMIVTNPNCSTIGLALVLKPLQDAFGVTAVQVVTMQAISGAGLEGVSAFEIQDNLIPHIRGEEEKLEAETAKILGGHGSAGFVPARVVISAQCNRVPVLDGHTESISVGLSKPATQEQIEEALSSFAGEVADLGLPSSPPAPILLRTEPDRPQPRLDRDQGDGMTVVVGRLRPCQILDWKFTALVHNMARGAAGAALLNAELLMAKGLL
jgi:aspartate-semialdehyde dehydrogenase